MAIAGGPEMRGLGIFGQVGYGSPQLVEGLVDLWILRRLSLVSTPDRPVPPGKAVHPLQAGFVNCFVSDRPLRNRPRVPRGLQSKKRLSLREPSVFSIAYC